MAGRKKQAVIRAVHSIKVSPMELDLLKRFAVVVRSGCGADIVLNTIDSMDILDSGIQPPPDGERKKTTIKAYNHEWEQLQKFVFALVRCANSDRLTLIKALEEEEQLSSSGSLFAVYTVVNKVGQLLVVDNLERAISEFIKLIQDAGAPKDTIDSLVSNRMYKSDSTVTKIVKLTKGEYTII